MITKDKNNVVQGRTDERSWRAEYKKGDVIVTLSDRRSAGLSEATYNKIMDEVRRARPDFFAAPDDELKAREAERRMGYWATVRNKYANEFARVFKVPLRKFWTNALLGFDVLKFDDEVVKSGRDSMTDTICRRWGKAAAEMISALLDSNPPPPPPDEPREYCCELCGRKTADETKSDHLRTLYMRSGTLERGYFLPQLNEEEKFILQENGPHVICSHRAFCRERRKRKAGGK